LTVDCGYNKTEMSTLKANMKREGLMSAILLVFRIPSHVYQSYLLLVASITLIT
jgi:hypothetical protein